MDCKDLQGMFIPFIDDQLSISDLDAFLHHLDNCKECREEYDIYYTMIIGMRYLEEQQNISEFKIDPQQKLDQAHDFLVRYHIFRIGKYLALALLCILFIFFI